MLFNQLVISGEDRLQITALFFLHDMPKEFGGATVFQGSKNSFIYQPKCGSALVFTNDLVYEGLLVKKGIKYTMEAQIMYRPKSS